MSWFWFIWRRDVEWKGEVEGCMFVVAMGIGISKRIGSKLINQEHRSPYS